MLVIGSLSFYSEKIVAQQYDTTAVRIVQNSLKIIEKYLSDRNSSQPVERAVLINFLTSLTGIQSQSDGTYNGQTAPTKDDVKNWTLWLEINKQNIFWENSSKSVILRKAMVVPERLQQKLIN